MNEKIMIMDESPLPLQTKEEKEKYKIKLAEDFAKMNDLFRKTRSYNYNNGR